MQIQYAALDAFTLDEDTEEGFHNPRKLVDKRDLTELAASIEHDGLRYPIQVWKAGEKLLVVDGGRRLRALSLLAQEKRARELTGKVPYVLVEARSAIEAAQVALVANVQRVELSSYEIAESLHRLKASGLSQEDMAKQLSKSQSWVSRMLSSYTKTTPAVHKAWQAKKLPDDDVQRLAKLPEPEQDKRLGEMLKHRDQVDKAKPGQKQKLRAAARQVSKGAPKLVRPDPGTVANFVQVTARAPKNNRYVQGMHDAFRFVLGEIGPGQWHKEFIEWAKRDMEKQKRADKNDKNGKEGDSESAA